MKDSSPIISARKMTRNQILGHDKSNFWGEGEINSVNNQNLGILISLYFLNQDSFTVSLFNRSLRAFNKHMLKRNQITK